MPSSWGVAGGVVAVYVAVGMYTGQSLAGEEAVFRSLAINALQLFAVAAMLHVRKFPERLPQTLTALAGTGIILGLLAFGFLLQADPEVNQPLLGLAWFGIFSWSLMVDAHIYRHALAISLSLGLLVTVLLLAASYVLVEVMF
jgi:hypothetical protein